MLNEDRNKTASHGCLMAMISEEFVEKIVNFSKRIIPECNLYIEDGEFGRETDSHVTIFYGFKPDISEIEIRKILKGTKPFTIQTLKLSQFSNNPEYDVVKMDVASPELTRLNGLCRQYPHESDYPEYHPHLTLAYVQKGKFGFGDGTIQMPLPVHTICYSPIVGEKSYYNLN